MVMLMALQGHTKEWVMFQRMTNSPDAIIMTINSDEMFEKYREIIQYLDGMNFLVGATKAVQT
jgi:uncharacterized FlgJ-related protein